MIEVEGETRWFKRLTASFYRSVAPGSRDQNRQVAPKIGPLILASIRVPPLR